MEKEILWEEMLLWPEDAEPVKGDNGKDSDEDDDEDDGPSNEHKNPLEQMFGMGKVHITPMGPIEIDDSYHPLRGIPFFIGSTNFNVKAEHIIKVNDIDGVEFVQLMSRYRFLVGIGQLFHPAIVLADIEKALGVTVEDDDEQKDNPYLDELKQKYDAKYGEGNWIGYVYPNGNVVEAQVSTDADIEYNINKFMAMKSLSGGEIIS